MLGLVRDRWTFLGRGPTWQAEGMQDERGLVSVRYTFQGGHVPMLVRFGSPELTNENVRAVGDTLAARPLPVRPPVGTLPGESADG